MSELPKPITNKGQYGMHCDHDWRPSSGKIGRDKHGALIIEIYCYKCGENRIADVIIRKTDLEN